MSLPRPRRLSDEDSRPRPLRFNATEKLTRAEILSELLALWELNIAIIDANEFQRIPGTPEARVDLEKAIKVLKATYKMENLLGCSVDFIAQQIDDACEKKPPKTARQHDEDVIL